jgi:hypothetical protein
VYRFSVSHLVSLCYQTTAEQWYLFDCPDSLLTTNDDKPQQRSTDNDDNNNNKISSTTSRASSLLCDICNRQNAEMANPDAIIPVDGMVRTCMEAQTLNTLSAESCQELQQNQYRDICGCRYKDETYQCNICGDDQNRDSIADPGAVLLTLGNEQKTCIEMQDMGEAGAISIDACGTIQDLASIACFCQVQIPASCDICDGLTIIDNEGILFVEGNYITCGEAQEMGLVGQFQNPGTCSIVQAGAIEVCGCEPETSNPTGAPIETIVPSPTLSPSVSFQPSVSARPSIDISGQDQLVTCVSVIDENDRKDVDAPYEELRERYPNRSFCLLQPDDVWGSRSGDLSIPLEFFNSTLNIFSNVTRDNEDSTNASDWYAICNLEQGRLQGITNVVLFVDNSGSMTNSTVQNALSRFVTRVNERGMTVVNAVYNDGEDYIDPCLLTSLVTAAPTSLPTSAPTVRIVNTASSSPSSLPTSAPSSTPSARPSIDIARQEVLVTCVSVIDENDSRSIDEPYEKLRERYPNYVLLTPAGRCLGQSQRRFEHSVGVLQQYFERLFQGDEGSRRFFQHVRLVRDLQFRARSIARHYQRGVVCRQ